MVKSLPVSPAAAQRSERLPLVHLNWTLLIGAVLVALVVFIAIAGPQLAPNDPQETNAIVRVGTAWVQPPFAPGAVPGFPLGSDERGRDIYSLLLWAVRPTLVLVGLVAAVRLVLGLLIGLVAGWSAARLGRALDVLISAALTAPVLIVALAVVAVLGVQGGQGLWAFIIGLSVTGWAETARVVRELTRGVRGQAYVEAARALGASDGYLLARHALPHVLPMAWVLLAFEVSGTILTVAGLGFLGYYTNDVWLMISDTTAQRFAGLPDLGQMLSTVSNDIFTAPYKMFMAGSMVFLTVLGFNLLGAGLRQQLNVERVRRRTQVTLAREWLRDVVEDRVRPALDSRWGQWARRAVAVAALAVLAVYGVRYWLDLRAAAANTGTALAVPGAHLWATERRDPFGTKTVGYAGPVSAPSIAWSFLPVTPTVLVALDRRLEHLDEFEQALVREAQAARIAVGVRVVLRIGLELPDVDLADERRDVLVVLVSRLGLRDADLLEHRRIALDDLEPPDVAAVLLEALDRPRRQDAVQVAPRDAVFLLEDRAVFGHIEQAER